MKPTLYIGTNFLGSFEKVKNLSVDFGFVGQLSLALQLGDEETLTELLSEPELQKLALRPTHLPNSLMPARKRAAL